MLAPQNDCTRTCNYGNKCNGNLDVVTYINKPLREFHFIRLHTYYMSIYL